MGLPQEPLENLDLLYEQVIDDMLQPQVRLNPEVSAKIQSNKQKN